MNWKKVCHKDELEMDDVLGFEDNEKLYAVYQVKDGFYCTDGLCSHENADMTSGYVQDNFVECPKHNARFNVKTGEALRKPACKDIKTYEVKVEDNHIYINI